MAVQFIYIYINVYTRQIVKMVDEKQPLTSIFTLSYERQIF